jgi:WD40 repeat protein/formylglycine-generating enzyme required for sulfatase activity
LLTAAEKEALLRHLEGCDYCAGQLKGLPEPDTLVELLRQAATVAGTAPNEVIARLVERLSRLRPGAPGAPPPANASVAPGSRLLVCPACGKEMKVPGELAGQLARCPYCEQVVRVVAAATPAPATTVDLGPPAPTNGAGKVDPRPARSGDEAYREFLSAAQGPDELGRLGPYRVLEVLGSGGMGVVFRAEDPQLRRMVALKAMLPALAVSDSARQRFLREAQTAAAIRHDHIVAVYQVGEDRGVPYLAMEFLEGEPLDRHLHREGKLPAAEVIRVGREIALGLAAAHKRGLIHRDIKPANIWLEAETGRVKILDFGLARATSEGGQLTQLGAVVGTPDYMAPEQAQGQAVDHRCDLFSLGCVLYRMATGQPAFHGSDLVSSLMAVNTHQPPPPHTLDPALPPALSQLIMTLLAKEPAGRPPSAQAVAETLERLSDVLARPAAATMPPARRRGCIMAGVAAGVVLLGVLILWAAGVFKVKTKDGTIVLENLPSDATVQVDGETVNVEWGQGQHAKISISPDKKHHLQIEKSGLKLFADAVEIDASGSRTISVRREPAAQPAPEPAAPLPRRYKNKLGMEFALIPRGKSWLGGGAGRPGDRVVEFKHDFYLGVYELTQEEWQKVTGTNPSGISRHGPGKHAVKDVSDEDLKRFPVEMVSWEMVQLFLEALNQKEKELGWIYRLPTEDEWKYACRGGPNPNRFESAYEWYFDKPTNEAPNTSQLNFWGHFKRTCKVGQYKPNKLGLYDMHGNVFEWCRDLDRTAPSGPLAVARGGGFWDHSGSGFCRTAHRGLFLPSTINDAIGLRLARIPTGKEPDTLKSVNFAPAAELESLRRDKIPAEALATAGDGDAQRAPAGLVAVLGDARPIHMDLVRSVAFSPDGRWLASGSFDKTIILRQAATGEVRRVLRGHTAPVLAVAFSRDGNTLVSASQDGTLKLWPAEGDAPPQALEPKLGEIWGMAVSPDGRFLAAGGTTGDVKLWRWGQWQTPMSLPRITGTLWIHFNGNRCAALAFSPDSTLLAVAHGGDQLRLKEADRPAAPIRLYRTADGTLAKMLPGHRRGMGGASDLVFRGDGKYLASFVQDDGVKLWDLTTGEAGASFAGQQFGAVVFTPDGKKIGVGGIVPSGIEFFSVPSQVREPLVSSAPGAAFSPIFSADGKLLAAGSYTGDLPVWDTSSGKQRHLQSGHRHFIRGLALSRGGRTLFSLGDDGTLREWDLARPGENRILHSFDTSVHLLAASPDGRRLAVSATFRSLWLWDREKGSASTVPWAYIDSLVFSPDGKVLAGCVNGIVRLWDTELEREVHQFKSVGRSPGLAFSADSRLLAAASAESKSVTVWKVASGAEVRSWRDTSMLAVAFQPRGDLLATGHEDGTISLWDVAEGKKKQTLTGHSAPVESLRFTPDGRTLVSSSHDGTLRVWDPAWQRARAVIPQGPANGRLVLDLDPSGKYLFAGGRSPLIFVLRLP